MNPSSFSVDQANRSAAAAAAASAGLSPDSNASSFALSSGGTQPPPFPMPSWAVPPQWNGAGGATPMTGMPPLPNGPVTTALLPTDMPSAASNGLWGGGGASWSVDPTSTFPGSKDAPPVVKPSADGGTLFGSQLADSLGLGTGTGTGVQPGSVDPSYLSSMYLPSAGTFDNATTNFGSSSLGSDPGAATTELQRQPSLTSTVPSSNPMSRTGEDAVVENVPSPKAAASSFPPASQVQPIFPFNTGGGSTSDGGAGEMAQSPVFAPGSFPTYLQPQTQQHQFSRPWASVDGRIPPPEAPMMGQFVPARTSSGPLPRSATLPLSHPFGPNAGINVSNLGVNAWSPKPGDGDVNSPAFSFGGDPRGMRPMPDIAEYPSPMPRWSTDATAMGSSAPQPSFDNRSQPGKQDVPIQVTPSGAVIRGATFLSRNVLPPSALGGHAASHPPGLGSRVLRAGSGLGDGIGMGIGLGSRPDDGTIAPPVSGMGYGGAATSAAATDFTKRKGWPLRVVEELIDFVHVLDPQGNILFASPSIVDLTGWRPEDLKGKSLAELVHPDDAPLVRLHLDPTVQVPGSDVVMYIRFRCKVTAASAKKGRDTTGESSGLGEDSSSTGSSAVRASSTSVLSQDRGKRKKARAPAPVPGRVVINNVPYVLFEFTGHPYFPPADLSEMVKQRKASHDVKKKEKVPSGLPSSPNKVGNNKPTSSVDNKSPHRGQDDDNLAGGIPVLPGAPDENELQCFFCSCRVHPTPNNTILDSFLELKVENERLRLMLQQLNMEEAASGGATGSTSASQSRRSSLGGERKVGPRPGNAHASRMSASGSFDLGLSPSVPEGADDDLKHKKKKVKTDEGDHVCADCGRVDSPEWRKGPLGPKTLCNACGLRWAKRIKRKGGDPNTAAMAFHQQASAAQHQQQQAFPDPHGMMGYMMNKPA